MPVAKQQSSLLWPSFARKVGNVSLNISGMEHSWISSDVLHAFLYVVSAARTHLRYHHELVRILNLYYGGK